MIRSITDWITAFVLLAVIPSCVHDEVGTTEANESEEPTRLLPAVLQAPLGFSTFLGGNGGDQVRDVATDAQGNVYAVGGTRSLDFPTTPGSFDRSHNGGMDIFVAKFSAAGGLVWSTLLGGPNYDRAYAVEIAPSGDVVIAGRSGGQLPGVTGSCNPVFKGGTLVAGYGPQDGFVCTLSGDGTTLRFCGYVGTLDENIVRDIAVDPLGNIYAFHLASKPGIPPGWTAGGYMPVYPGEGASLVLKITPDGRQVIGGTWYGGNRAEGATGTLRWAAGRVHVVSTTSSTNLPTPGGFDHTLSGAGDIYLAVFSDDLRSLAYATYIGGSGHEEAETHNAAVDGLGNTFIGAVTTSTDLPGTAGNFQATNHGNKEGFVMKVGPTGSLLAATYVGGSSNDGFQGVAVTSYGRVFLSTISSSLDFPVTQLALGSRLGTSAGLVIFSRDLKTLLFSQMVGGSLGDESRAIALGPDGSVALGGTTQSSDWYQLNALQSKFGGGTLDGVLLRLTPSMP